MMPPPNNPPIHCLLTFGAGDCSEYNYCQDGRSGTCVQGLCECFTGYTGRGCETHVECQYWDVKLEIWNTEGCIASPPPSGKPDGFLHCNCTHLTDFGGVSFPTTADELIAELTSIKFTVFTMDDLASALTDSSAVRISRM